MYQLILLIMILVKLSSVHNQSLDAVASEPLLLKRLTNVYQQHPVTLHFSSGYIRPAHDKSVSRVSFDQESRPATESESRMLDLKLRMRQAINPSLQEAKPLEDGGEQVLAKNLKSIIDNLMNEAEKNDMPQGWLHRSQQATTTARPSYSQIPRPFIWDDSDDHEVRSRAR